MGDVREYSIPIFVTTDDKEFDSKAEAKRHQMTLDKDLCWYLLSYAPDLTEGRGMMRQGYVVVNANKYHNELAIHACHETFGSPYAFAQGVFGTNALCSNWKVCELFQDEIDPTISVIITVEERFVKNKIFGEGIHRVGK